MPPEGEEQAMREGARGLALAIARLRRLDGGAPAVARVLEALGDRSAPLLLLLLGLIAMVPSPGLPVGMVFGSIAAIVAIQMLILRRRLALPRRLARRPIPAPLLRAAVRRGVPWLRRLQGRLRTRLPWAAGGAGTVVAGAVILVQSVLIALPIPFGNTLPALAVMVLSLGLAVRDGLMVLAGHGLALLAAGVSAGLLWGTVAVVGAVA